MERHATVSLLRALNPFTNREMEPTPDDVADDLLSLSFTSTATTTSDATLTATSSFSFSSASSPRLLSLSDLKFLLRLGSGDICSVYLAELSSPPLPTSPSDPLQHHEAPSPAMFAAKVMDKKELASRNKEGRARTEMEILEMLQHPFLPSLYAAVDSQKWLCLLTEFCPGGDLHVLRQRQPLKRFEESAVRFYASEVVVALEYLHMMGIVYRDLKPENVLVRSDGHIMLTDFDLSLKCDTSTSTAQIVSDTIQLIPAFLNGHVNPGDQAPPFSACILPNCIVPVVSCFHPKRHRRKRPARRHAGLEFVAKPVDVRSMSFVGTHEYLAPEIVSGEGHGSAVDWWTLGIFIFELFHGVTPFRGLDNEMILTNIVARALEFPKEPNVPAAAKDLISQLLVKDPDRRLGSTMGASALRHHPFFNGVNWALLRCTTPPFVPQPFSKDLLPDESCLETPVDYY